MLFREGRHEGPVIVDMRHSMSIQHFLVQGTQLVRIPDFNGIPDVSRQVRKKPVQPSEEFLQGQSVAFKLEQERPGVRAESGVSIGL